MRKILLLTVLCFLACLLPACGCGDSNTLSIDLGKGVKLKMVKIPAGTFQMGSPDTETLDKYQKLIECPVHTVTIPRDFYIGKFEVTQGQWKVVMNGDNPSEFKKGNNYPVEKVSAVSICKKGGFLDKINALRPGGYSGFRLPTEAEWEYACRAGTTTAYYWGESFNGDYLWYEGNSGGRTHPVGSAPGVSKGISVANAFGLYDMLGNVEELCNDNIARYDDRAVIDCYRPVTEPCRVTRGGCWNFPGSSCRSTSRYADYYPDGHSILGFRLVLEVK